MKKIAAKVITISSQILVVSLFLLLLFSGNEGNDKAIIVYNKNFEKMADVTSSLFEKEKLSTQFVDENIVIELNDSTDTFLEDENVLVEEDNSVIENIIENENQDEINDNIISLEPEVIETYTGILTGYGPDCVGCGNFNTGKVSTSTGYHIANIVDGKIEPAFTITYNDSEFGEVRIVAADDDIPFYSIVRITVPDWDESVTAIVLDRGSTVGFDNCRSDRGCLTNFDLLYASESESLGKTQNVKFEILRSGK